MLTAIRKSELGGHFLRGGRNRGTGLQARPSLQQIKIESGESRTHEGGVDLSKTVISILLRISSCPS